MLLTHPRTSHRPSPTDCLATPAAPPLRCAARPQQTTIQLRGRLIEHTSSINTAGAGRYAATSDAAAWSIVVCDDLDDAIRLRQTHADRIVVMWDRSGRARSSDVSRGLDARLDAYVTGAAPELLLAHLHAARRRRI